MTAIECGAYEAEITEEENEQGGESEGDKVDGDIQMACDVSGGPILLATRKVPVVGSVTATGCFGFTFGNLIIRPALGL